MQQRKANQLLEQEVDKKNRQIAMLRLKILNLTTRAVKNPETVRRSSMINRVVGRLGT